MPGVLLFSTVKLINRHDTFTADNEFCVLKFQVPMPNSPRLLNHLCFGAHFLQESRLSTEVFILVCVCAVVMATGLVKNKA